MGSTLLNTTFYVVFVLTSSRTAEAFIWVLERLKEVYIKLELDLPRIIITDNKKNLIIPIQKIFPEAIHLFYI